MTESRMQGFAAGRYAAIDIGTVTCRMLVADVDAAGAIHEVDREYAITNLGEGVDATGMLLPAAIDRTVETVGGYCAVRNRLAEQGAPIAKTIAVATSASRDAGNSDEFVRRLAELGVVLSVIPGWKEAGLSFSGASCDFPGQDLMGVDIGGGSTEMVVGRAGQAHPPSLKLRANGWRSSLPSISGKPGRPAWRLSVWWRSRVRLPRWSRCATRCACTIRRRCIRRT